MLRKGCVGMGMLDDIPKIEMGICTMEEPSKLLCYTDGLIELVDDEGIEFGTETLEKHLSNRRTIQNNIQEIIEVAKEEEIKVIFVQKQFSTHNAEVIAREINGRVVQIDPLSYNWAENLKLIVDEIVKSYNE